MIFLFIMFWCRVDVNKIQLLLKEELCVEAREQKY